MFWNEGGGIWRFPKIHPKWYREASLSGGWLLVRMIWEPWTGGGASLLPLEPMALAATLERYVNQRSQTWHILIAMRNGWHPPGTWRSWQGGEILKRGNLASPYRLNWSPTAQLILFICSIFQHLDFLILTPRKRLSCYSCSCYCVTEKSLVLWC